MIKCMYFGRNKSRIDDILLTGWMISCVVPAGLMGLADITAG